jgi:alkylhydroperoxidase family enzyme
VATLNDCEYCVSAHRRLARLRGATAEQVAALANFETGPFSEAEKAGFRYAALLHTSGHAVTDEAYAALSRHFEIAQIVELTAITAAFEMFPRINTALRIPVTPLPAC